MQETTKKAPARNTFSKQFSVVSDKPKRTEARAFSQRKSVFKAQLYEKFSKEFIKCDFKQIRELRAVAQGLIDDCSDLLDNVDSEDWSLMNIDERKNELNGLFLSFKQPPTKKSKK